MKAIKISLFILILGCSNSKQDNIGRDFQTLLNNLHIPIENKTYIIIPFKSCYICKEKAFLFLKENLEKSKDFTFIITEIADRIELHDYMKAKKIDLKEVYLDTNYLVGKEGFYSIYPQIIRVEDGQVTKTFQIKESNINLWNNL